MTARRSNGDFPRLILVRHAHRDTSHGRERDNGLSPKGEKQAEFLAAHFLASDRQPTLILTSRLRRAIETAQILADALGCPMRDEPTLGLGHPVSEVLEVLEILIRNNGIRDVVLVGHNPQVESLVEVLTHGPSGGGAGGGGIGGGVRMRTGECAVLEVRSKGGLVMGADLLELVRLISPD